MTQMLTDRYHERLAGTLSCYDRIVITGTLPGACYAAGMTSFLNARHIRIFDYPRFAEPLRDRIREAAQALATAQGARIEHVAKAHIRKEDLVAAVLKDRGDHPGLVHVLSAMEACDAYEPWHDKPSHQTFLRHTSGKCLHYYFYWMDGKRSAPPPLEEQDHAGLLSGLRGNNSSMRLFGQEGSFSRVLVSQAMGSMSFMRAVSSRD
jgi:hypothetical protein